MSYNIFPIAAARENSLNSSVPYIAQEIINIINNRIEAASLEGKWYTDYFYTYWGNISMEKTRKIISEVEDEYRKEHYNIIIKIEEHNKEVLKLYIKIVWGEVTQE